MSKTTKTTTTATSTEIVVKKIPKKKIPKKDSTKKTNVAKSEKSKSWFFRNETSTQFKAWCFKNNISQVKLSHDTKLSIGCIHGVWNVGKATASTIKLIALVYGLDEEKLKKKITTFEKVDNKMKTDTVFNPDNKLSLD